MQSIYEEVTGGFEEDNWRQHFNVLVEEDPGRVLEYLEDIEDERDQDLNFMEVYFVQEALDELDGPYEGPLLEYFDQGSQLDEWGG